MEQLMKALEQPINIYIPEDGRIVIDRPKGRPMDHATAQRIAVQIVAEYQKSPAPCANTEQGSTTEKAESKGHLEYTASAARSQGGF